MPRTFSVANETRLEEGRGRGGGGYELSKWFSTKIAGVGTYRHMYVAKEYVCGHVHISYDMHGLVYVRRNVIYIFECKIHLSMDMLYHRNRCKRRKHTHTHTHTYIHAYANQISKSVCSANILPHMGRSNLCRGCWYPRWSGSPCVLGACSRSDACLGSVCPRTSFAATHRCRVRAHPDDYLLQAEMDGEDMLEWIARQVLKKGPLTSQ